MILLYLLIFVMPLTRHRIWSLFVGDLTMIKYLGFACVPGLVFHLARRRTLPQFFGTWQSRWFLLFVFVAVGSSLLLGPPSRWIINHGATYASFLLLFFIVLGMVDSLKRLRWVLLVAIGAEAFASLYVIREWQKYGGIYADFRPGSVVGDPNYYTASALLCLPLAFYLFREKRPRLERLYCLGCLMVTVLGTALAASRGGFLGLVAAFLFVVLRSGRVLRNLALAGVLLVPLSVLSPSSPLERLLHPTTNDEKSGDARKAIWKGGLRIIRQHPVMGVGLDNFRRRVGFFVNPEDVPEGERIFRVAHNTYLEVAAELGLPMLFIFFGMLSASFLSLEKTRRRTLRSGPPLLQHVALGIQGGLVGFAVATFFVSAHYEKMFWLMLFLSMCLPELAASNSEVDQAERPGQPASHNRVSGTEPADAEPRIIPSRAMRTRSSMVAGRAGCPPLLARG